MIQQAYSLNLYKNLTPILPKWFQMAIMFFRIAILLIKNQGVMVLMSLEIPD